jgi:hypothetical protein
MPTGYSYFAERQLRSRIDLGHSSPQPWRPSFSAAQSMKRHGWIASTADEPKQGARARTNHSAPAAVCTLDAGRSSAGIMRGVRAHAAGLVGILGSWARRRSDKADKLVMAISAFSVWLAAS